MAYSDKPMKKYFETVNGRQVPVFYPQYWDEDLQDWVISSKNSALPVSVDNPQESVDVNNFPANQQTTITNDEANAVPTKLTGSRIAKTVYSPRTTDLAPGGTSNFIDTTKPYRLEYLEWACNSKNTIRLVIKSPDSTEDITPIVNTDGSGIVTSARPDNILNNYAGIWDILVYNESANTYKFRLRLQGLEFPKGVRIYLENPSWNTTNQKAGGIMYGSEIK